MNADLILWPVVIQVLLTLGMYVLLGNRKAAAVKAGQVDRKQAALDNKAWPEPIVLVSNNIANQFELPVLFYTLCLLLHSSDQVGGMALVLAWVFVLSRLAHAYVHVTSNYVPHRLGLFMVGVVSVLLMTFIAAWGLF